MIFPLIERRQRDKIVSETEKVRRNEPNSFYTSRHVYNFSPLQGRSLFWGISSNSELAL
jgi:hypothetical protein